MIYLNQLIYIKQGQEETFHQFEDVAIPLMTEHGGKVIYRLRPQKENFISCDGERPYEIHFLSFPSDLALNNFLNDERRLAIIQLKEDSIKSTFLIKGIPM